MRKVHKMRNIVKFIIEDHLVAVGEHKPCKSLARLKSDLRPFTHKNYRELFKGRRNRIILKIMIVNGKLFSIR